MLSMKEACLRFLNHPFNVKGRAQRSEFWWCFLAIYLVGFALIFIAALLSFVPFIGPIISFILVVGWGLGALIFTICVGIRRLHDSNKSGWWILLCFIPYIGSLIFIILMVIPGTIGPNRFGDDPLGYTNPIPTEPFSNNNVTSNQNTSKAFFDANSIEDRKDYSEDSFNKK